MKQNKLYNTAIYCRLSLDDGNEGDSSSIKIQKMMLEKYALEHGFTIYDYYIDDGYSGLNFERPAFKKMMQDINDGKINAVITKDLSRLGRNHILKQVTLLKYSFQITILDILRLMIMLIHFMIIMTLHHLKIS